MVGLGFWRLGLRPKVLFVGFIGKTEETNMKKNKRDRGRKEEVTDVESF